MGVSPLDVARRRVYLPWTRIPEGRLVDLPGRGGSTYVTGHARRRDFRR